MPRKPAACLPATLCLAAVLGLIGAAAPVRAASAVVAQPPSAGDASGSQPGAAVPQTASAPAAKAMADRPGGDQGTPGKTLLLGKPDQTLTLGSTDKGTGNLIWESLAAVLIILILGGGILFVMRRLMPRIAQARGKQILLMETFHLGPQRALHLVQVGGQRLLLGISRDGIRLLADVTATVPPPVNGQTDPAAAKAMAGKPETKLKFVIPPLDADVPGAGSNGVENT